MQQSGIVGGAMTSRDGKSILWTRVLCKQPGRYIGWPGVTRAPNGELLAVFSGDRDAHICPYGKTQLIRSSDQGQTWSPPETITNSPLDDRDAGILALRDGALILRWFTLHVHPEAAVAQWIPRDLRETWREHCDRITTEDVATWAPVGGEREVEGPRGHWLRRSTDGGRTWSPPLRVAGSSPKAPIECADGRLVLIGTDGRDQPGRTSRIVVEESKDCGCTWRVIARLPMFFDDSNVFLCEPHLVEVEAGRLTAMARCEPLDQRDGFDCSYLHQCDSGDGGKTWTAWRPTPVWGKPPHLLRLRDGRLVLTYGHRRPPFGERACLSRDGGRTWDLDHELLLSHAPGPGSDLGYPVSVELDDGTILTVYYQNENKGEKPCLMATRWQPLHY